MYECRWSCNGTIPCIHESVAVLMEWSRKERDLHRPALYHMGGIVVLQTDEWVDHWAVCRSFRKSASLPIYYSDVPDKDSSRHNVAQRKTGWQTVLEKQEDVWFRFRTSVKLWRSYCPCANLVADLCAGWRSRTKDVEEKSWAIREMEGFGCFRIEMVLDNLSGGFGASHLMQPRMVFDLREALHHASENPFFRARWTDMWSKTQW